MEYDSRQVLQPHLQSDEQLLWCSKPASGIKFGIQDTFLIPFSIFWAGFALVWEAIAIWSGAPFFFPLFGLPFVVIGYQMLIGRFFKDAAIRSKTFYGITNKRAIIVYEGKTNKVKSWELKRMNIECTQNKNGTGSITFGESKSNTVSGISMPFVEPVLTPEFRMIEDVDRVEKILQRAKAGNDSGGSFWEEAKQYEQGNSPDNGVEDVERS